MFSALNASSSIWSRPGKRRSHCGSASFCGEEQSSTRFTPRRAAAASEVPGDRAAYEAGEVDGDHAPCRDRGASRGRGCRGAHDQSLRRVHCSSSLARPFSLRALLNDNQVSTCGSMSTCIATNSQLTSVSHLVMRIKPRPNLQRTCVREIGLAARSRSFRSLGLWASRRDACRRNRRCYSVSCGRPCRDSANRTLPGWLQRRKDELGIDVCAARQLRHHVDVEFVVSGGGPLPTAGGFLTTAQKPAEIAGF